MLIIGAHLPEAAYYLKKFDEAIRIYSIVLEEAISISGPAGISA